jgi:hypothetical protein
LPAAPAALPPAFPAETRGPEGGAPLSGWHGTFFLRDSKDYFRIYPRLRLHIDFTTSFGPGVGKIKVVDGGSALKPRVFIRRLESEFSGEFFKVWTFHGGFEATQPIANANGRQQLYASKAGEAPTAGTARYSPVEATSAGIGIADAWVNYTVGPWLNIMVGQYQVPFTMENRTGNKTTSFMDRSIAIRAFARTSGKDIGATFWGEVADKLVNYEIGVFSGDGQNRPQIDNNFDFMGRIFVKPFVNNKGSLLQKAQIGLSAHHGDRDPKYVAYDYAAITTSNGTALWSPSYKDALGRYIHVIPSAGQNAIGGELRLPIGPVDIRGEAYYVANNTREAVEGYQTTNTERFGKIGGVAWYAQVSAWVLGDGFVSGDPGMVRPTRIDLAKAPEVPKKGLEVLALISGINASYDGAARQGEYDEKTPGNPDGKVAKNITVLQYGLGLNYWLSSYIRTSVNYIIYHTPGSASPDNLAQVPGNTVPADTGTELNKEAHLVQELGARIGVAF